MSMEEILDFWFGPVSEDGLCDDAFVSRWFRKDPTFDAEIRAQFGWVYAQLAVREQAPPAWLSGTRGTLAAIIVLDQFSRNMFRDSASMFAADAQARALCFEMIALGYDRQLPAALRTFVYMPLMHSERLVDQERCVELFQSMADELHGEVKKQVMNNVKYAIAHRDIVARFARFPHRNRLLGRVSSAEEEAFLKQPGSSF